MGSLQLLSATRSLCIDIARRTLPASVMMQLRSLAVARLKGDHRDIFTEIHRRNIWGYQESVSGAGSTLDYTEELRSTLPALLRDLDVQTLLDVPCGDFNWMREVDLKVAHYIGGDIVSPLIVDMQAKYGSPAREFVVLDLCKDTLPAADLLLVRDCFIHLSEEMIFRALANIIRSDIKYLLATTYPGARNRSIRTGDWFAINLCHAPYNFPAPRQILNDWKPPFDERCLGLWEMADLRHWARTAGAARLALLDAS
jgi:hypothetical protein